MNDVEVVEAKNHKLGLVLKIAKLGFWDFKPGDDVMNWSARAKSFFGASPGFKMTYERFLSGLHRDDRERVDGAINAALREDVGSYTVEFRTIGIEDRVERIVLAVGDVVFDGDHRARRVIGVSSDVTEQRRQERELIVAKQAAESASLAKSDFLANMSHEIRTPLGAVLGFAELAADPAYGEEERAQFIAKIRDNGSLLDKLIGQILDLSKLEADRMELESTRFSLVTALREVMSSLSLVALRKGIELRLTSDGPVPSFVEMDQLRFKQVLLNVIGNAVKFTERGQVVVTVALASIPKPGQRMTLSISVADTGIGISVEKRRRLFERFGQADSSMTRKYGGTGLGLALSKKFALALGGDLILKESTPNFGSTFVFYFSDAIYDHKYETVDLSAPEGTQFKIGPGTLGHHLAGVRILVVDDSEDNQTLLSISLRSVGAVVEVARDGAEALDKAQAQTFDVILMDIQMPVLDGISAMHALRERGFVKPIIALTARALDSDREISLGQGFDDHFNKPIRLERLIRDVAQYARNRGGAPELGYH